MNPAMKVEPESSDDKSIWLELCVDGESHTFELKADELRAVAVGSLLRADLRIDRPGVEPVQFHIERDDGALWIVPAYNSSDLRVDTARVIGSHLVPSAFGRRSRWACNQQEIDVVDTHCTK